jgi:hypothetical protein
MTPIAKEVRIPMILFAEFPRIESGGGSGRRSDPAESAG